MPFFAPEPKAGTAPRGKLLVISGPSGVGKGTLINLVLPHLENTRLSTSATTRPRRQDEQEGREYYFLSDDEFDARIDRDDFIEHVDYGSNRYGTLRSEVEDNLAAGRSVILEIELQGARSIRRKIPEAILFFIAPPDPEDLRRRLEGRNTESADEINKRLAQAGEELASQKEFDYIVVNDKVDEAAKRLEELIVKAQGGRT